MDHYSLGILYIVAVKALGIGSATVIAVLGYRLFLKGVDGTSSLVANAGEKYSLQLLNASPGLFFLLSGAIVMGLLVFDTSVYEETRTPEGAINKTVIKGGSQEDSRIYNAIALSLLADAESLAPKEKQRRCTKLAAALYLTESATRISPDTGDYEDTFTRVSKEHTDQCPR